MSLQNRVTPFGDIVSAVGRGLLMGNRGILHDGERRIVRYAQGRRWIACRTQFRGRRRLLMTSGAYTELFFLDEATALAAGHRPCAECRRADYRRFRAAWMACHGPEPLGVDGIDRRLHDERLRGRASKRTYLAEMADLPGGVYVVVDGGPWLVWNGQLLGWSPGGYVERRTRPAGVVTVLTPPAIVDTIAAGYSPLVHPSAT